MFGLIVLVLLLSFLAYIKWRQTYWQRRGIVCEPPPFLLGTLKPVVTQKKSFGDVILEAYRSLKRLNSLHGGIYFFSEPVYFPMDIALIKQILTKDFAYFNGHGSYHHPKDVLTMNLFNVQGDYWKFLRTKLTPTFTSGKMKMMFETLVEKAPVLEGIVSKFASTGEPFAAKDLVARFTTDVIGSCAFGIECNSMEETESQFRKFGKKLLQNSSFTFALISIFPWEWIGNSGFLFYGREVTDFFTRVVQSTVRAREENPVFRKDFMQLLLQMKNHDGNVDKITEEEIVAQCFVFFLGGFETSSTVMAFALLRLVQHPDIQEKVQQEISQVLQANNGEITYEAIMSMSYLDQVVNETLRQYPPVSVLPRTCSKTYKVPNSDLTVEAGTRVMIPVLGIHMDPEYYPEPEKFVPERFKEENKHSRPDFAFLPFGEGPRMCIGLRFGLLQTKVGLVALLRKFTFTLNPKTPLPIRMDPHELVPSVKGEIWLNSSEVVTKQ